MPRKKEVMPEEVQEKKVTEVNPADIIREALMKTKREGMADLLDAMAEWGFLTAPCSGGHHLCEEGGLAKHSVNVLKNAEKIGVSLLGGAEYNKIQDSVIIAALLHDLGKCGDFGKEMYVPNILKTGQSKAKPFKINPELPNIPHSIRSIKLATLYIDLTPDEEWAIYAHDGLYDHAKQYLQGHETQLSMIIHWADMWASKVDESVEGGAEE